VSLVPAILILLYVGYSTMVPRYSAVAYFENFGFNLRLDFYRTDEAVDTGRYLTVINSGGYYRFMIQGWDWTHRARTSVYRIDANRLAALSAMGYDYEMTLKPWNAAPAGSGRGDRWQYLGAFDFAFPPGEKPRLEFFDAQPAECIPMGKADPSSWTDKPRVSARRAACPSP